MATVDNHDRTSNSDPDRTSDLNPSPAADVVDPLDRAIVVAHGDYVAARPKSADCDREARKVMPGGNTRSVLHFDPFPFRIARAEGSVVTDVDGHDSVDFCGNYTAGLLGHSSKLVRDAVVEALDEGFAIGATHPREIELAHLIRERFDAIDQVRFTNSGTEANLMAIGTALHFTGRSGVGVFSGGYHGGVLSFGGAGNPLNVPHNYTLAPYNDLSGLDTLFDPENDLGCVVVEAVQGSGGCRPASEEFVKELARRCTADGTLLILDEVMTSRLAPGGAQELYGIAPDMTTLGKYLGGGMSFGAFGGRADVMAAFDPSQGGALTQAGTFNNNVVSMAAAVATLRDGLDAEVLAAVNARGDRLRHRLHQDLSAAHPEMWVTGRGSMLNVHAGDDRWLELYFHQMLAAGHYLARRGFIALSMAVTAEQIDALVSSTQQWAQDTHTLWRS